MLIQRRLKYLLDYDEYSGVFTWKVSSGRVKAGTHAKSLQKSTGYLRIKIDKKQYPVHRLAFLYMEGRFPIDSVDHINHVKTDNRWANLRHASCEENIGWSAVNSQGSS